MATGMPIIAPEMLSSVFYLYRTIDDAKSGRDSGGTGFFASVPSNLAGDTLGHHYGITNWHVARKQGFSVIRLNTITGEPDYLDFDPGDWECDPKKDDIAIIPLSIRDPSQKAFFISAPHVFIKEEAVIFEKWGPGDDVFMIGRFMDNVEDKNSNIPFTRFGNISSQLVKVKQPTGYKDGKCFCIDMHSRTGFSGSPVFAYRTPGNDLRWMVYPNHKVEMGRASCALLGIHCAQWPEELIIKDGNKMLTVEGWSGMTVVVPAWRILEMLDQPKFVKQREAEEKRREKEMGKSISPKEEVAEDDLSGDEILRRAMGGRHTLTPKAKPARRGRGGVSSK